MLSALNNLDSERGDNFTGTVQGVMNQLQAAADRLNDNLVGLLSNVSDNRTANCRLTGAD